MTANYSQSLTAYRLKCQVLNLKALAFVGGICQKFISLVVADSQETWQKQQLYFKSHSGVNWMKSKILSFTRNKICSCGIYLAMIHSNANTIQCHQTPSHHFIILILPLTHKKRQLSPLWIMLLASQEISINYTRCCHPPPSRETSQLYRQLSLAHQWTP